MPFAPKPHSALLIVGHGSTKNSDSSTPYFDHAAEIRKRNLFAEVHVCFWKEEPSLREALFMIDSTEVYIVPDFISEGYFTQEIIPREFELQGPTTQRDGKTLHYCLPVGIHPSMTDLILRHAWEIAPKAKPSQTTLIITGHGTGLNQNSTKAIRDQVELISKSTAGYKHVTDAYIEEAPLISDWHTFSDTKNVVVVPFFISDGLHSYQDIPELLGIEPTTNPTNLFRKKPHRLRGKSLYYSSAIGTDPLLADIILDQIADFDATHHPTPPTAFNGTTLAQHLKNLVRSGINQIGEIRIQQDLCEYAYALHHIADEDLATQPAFGGLDHHHGPDSARELSTHTENGDYRFLKSKPDLPRGWLLSLDTEEELLRALNLFYPASFALFIRHKEGKLPVQHFRTKLSRQTGMYRNAKNISTEGAQKLIQDICGPTRDCAKKILWQIDDHTPLTDSDTARYNGIHPSASATNAISLLCQEPCNHLVAKCRIAARNEATINQDPE